MFNFFKKKDETYSAEALSKKTTDNAADDNSKGDSADSLAGISDILGFNTLKSALSKTSSALVKSVLDIAGSKDTPLDEFELEDIESILIKADLGVDFTLDIIQKLKSNKIKSSALKEFLKEEFLNILHSAGENALLFEENKLNIYFVTGVNGAGKTTLIGRLAHKFKTDGKKVLLAAGDTFRAAAEEQLDIWAKRADVDIVRKDGADSASVVYEAIQKAKLENYNALIVDTAGRLQNKFNLIEELKKIKNVISKNAPDANVESILVLDANLGQNGLMQAKAFNEAVDLTSVALTKLDGSAKGGIILAVAKEYKLPAKLIGIGEKIDDLRDFNAQDFIEAIFS